MHILHPVTRGNDERCKGSHVHQTPTAVVRHQMLHIVPHLVGHQQVVQQPSPHLVPHLVHHEQVQERCPELFASMSLAYLLGVSGAPQAILDGGDVGALGLTRGLRGQDDVGSAASEKLMASRM